MSRDIEDEIRDEKNPRPLDEDDIALLKTYGLGPYSAPIKKVEKEIKELAKRINDLCGIKESDTGLAPPSQWDLVSDKQMMQEEQPLQVARCTKIISPNTEDAKYVINVKQIAKFVVGLGDKVSPTDIEEGMRVGVDRNKYQIQIPLPPKIDPSVTMMTVEEKPDVTYNDVGGCKEQIEKMREVVELPMLHPEKFVKLGIDPPKGVLCYGPPGTGKTLLARAVANRTDACFIRVIGSELVQKYVGEGARMVRELFQMARSKKACIVFFDEVDAIGGARFDDGVGGDNEMSVIIGTTVGDLLIDLFIEKCPKTCLNFLKLCKIKYYHNSLFHTVSKDSIAVTGDPTGTGTGGDSISQGEQFFDNEIHPDLNHFGNGQYGSKSECISVFGVVVVEGRDTMSQLKESSVNKEHRPYNPIRIIGTEIIDDPFDDPPKLAQLIPVSTDEEGDSVSTGGSTDEEHELRVCLWNQKLKGSGPYSAAIKKVEKEVEDLAKKINYLCDTDTGLAPSSQWDLASDKRMIKEEKPLHVARCTSVISPNTPDAQYVISFKQRAKFAVGLGDNVSPTDIKQGMRVGVDMKKYQIQIPLLPKIDHRVTMMTVEEKPDVTYNDVGGCKEQIEKIRAVVELPMLHPEKFVKLGIDPPKGVLCYGPPGTGKTLLARAVANRTDACFIRVIGSELVQKYVGEGARMVRELFQMARSKKACIVFFDEVDAIGGARFDDGVGGDNEVQRTMLEIVNQLDGFDARGNIKVLMATNRPDTLDPALLRPGRLDLRLSLELISGVCALKLECMQSELGERKTVTEKDFLDAVNKVIKGYQKFSAIPKYMPHYV
ncbi:hypothetical protein F2Q69_00048019 [Brassica cretica]|uniref:PPIase cyclophilin-type domain-containing protein n=1 Tax=Brassica cretica TaxID=69181 RepID=A0A8S9PKF2_BRACR|nr:hypothetical protein F2Q69_00048019 [Brassica cretica]